MAHPSAYIHPDAQIAEDVEIGPFVAIEGDVTIDSGTWIGAHVSVMDGTRIGKNCKIFPGAVLGALPQDLKFQGEQTTLEIGDHVIIREYCTLNRGTKARGATTIDDRAMLMAYVHVAHDCLIGKHAILANNAALAGHIEVGEYAILGGLAAVHQFVRIGAHAMVGGGSLVRKDVPPYVKAARNPLSYVGINSIGLKRRGFDRSTIHQIQNIYRTLFVKGHNTTQAVEHIKNHEATSVVRDHILDFIEQSERGIMRGFQHMNGK